jgi:hypothetical protein
MECSGRRVAESATHLLLQIDGDGEIEQVGCDDAEPVILTRGVPRQPGGRRPQAIRPHPAGEGGDDSFGVAVLRGHEVLTVAGVDSQRHPSSDVELWELGGRLALVPFDESAGIVDLACRDGAHHMQE